MKHKWMLHVKTCKENTILFYIDLFESGDGFCKPVSLSVILIWCKLMENVLKNRYYLNCGYKPF